MATISKRELIDRIADKLDLKRVVVKRVVQNFLDEIIVELCRDNRVEFRDFGVFKCRQRAARLGHNPRTLERVAVPSHRIVNFKVALHVKSRMAATTPQKPNVIPAPKPGITHDGAPRETAARATNAAPPSAAKA